MPNVEKSRIPLLSFFSGGGFLDMGFKMAGFEIAFSTELDKDFAQFYKEGMSSWSGVEKKISAIADINNLRSEYLQGFVKHPFGIIGGPPCQDFSIRGSKNGFSGIRGTLTYSYYEKIMDLQPDFFLMENVPGLVLLKKTKDSFNAILNLFREDYLISCKRLNSLEYGLPQSRERLFVFGMKKSRVSNLEINEDDWFEWPQPKFPNASISYNWGEPKDRLIISNLSLPDPPEELCVNKILINESEELKIPNAREYFNLKNPKKIQSIEEGDTYRPSFKRLHRKKYSPTACYGNNEVHIHPTLTRRLSVREALRIQGVPDSYVISTQGNLTKKFKMIGNGVPIPLAYQVGLAIKLFLTKVNFIGTKHSNDTLKELV
ncbi:DNA cytosine methyltransferase [Salinimicrobium catena]|uniref:DNA cytosine methyltransferase n=1 Tax=Salinimicrobium catena TaxID=390640 RepID=UPI002FE463B6